MTEQAAPFREIFYTARDGLRLYGRHYAARGSAAGRRPVLCLPGLTRNSRDFHAIALHLAQHPAGARDVYTLDYRGRGASAFDPEWRNYAVPVEMVDVVDFITLNDLAGAAILGTSRGGLITMVMSAAHPQAVTGPVILNDIGPVIEAEGLSRIAAYVGRMPLPGSWADAGKLAAELNRRAFPALSDAEWIDVARQWFNEQNGKPAPGYDMAIANAFSVLDGPLPDMWAQFETLKRVPVMVIRGENTDLLSPETVGEMQRRHGTLSALTVAREGHAPLLRDLPTNEAIRAFLAETDRA